MMGERVRSTAARTERHRVDGCDGYRGVVRIELEYWGG